MLLFCPRFLPFPPPRFPLSPHPTPRPALSVHILRQPSRIVRHRLQHVVRSARLPHLHAGARRYQRTGAQHDLCGSAPEVYSGATAVAVGAMIYECHECVLQ